jgi:hypothetical protein
VVVVVVVTSVVVGLSLGLGELLSGGSLGLGVQVLDLGLTKDAGAGSVCRAGGRLVDIGLVDDKEDLGETGQPKFHVPRSSGVG